jgi:hypothetical protein
MLRVPVRVEDDLRTRQGNAMVKAFLLSLRKKWFGRREPAGEESCAASSVSSDTIR